MDWKQLLVYITGSVDQELLLRHEYLVTENRLLRKQLQGRVRLTDAERKTLAEIGKKLGKQALEEVATIVPPAPERKKTTTRSAPTKARGIACSCPRPGACSVRGPSNAMKGLVDSSRITAAKRHEDVDATRMLTMVGTQTPLQEKPASITQRVTLYGISWQTYTRILVELGDQRASRLAYAQGVLEITMPSDRHETYKKLLERMIETLTEELNLPAKSFGATTLNRVDLEHGAEPDSCYYIQHVHQIAGRQVDLATDPPPDLILEIDISSPSSRRIDIYKQLGVPEIWRYSGGNVHVYRLQDGEYVPCDQSPSFPLVSPTIINQFLQQAETQDDTTFIRTWRQWVRQQVASEPGEVGLQ